MGQGEPACLLADVGGTHSRLALQYAAADPLHARVFYNADFDGLAALVEAYLQGVPQAHPVSGAFAVACPVAGDRIHLTNLAWEFSVDALRGRLGLERLTVVNDFEAIALAVPELGSDDIQQIGGGTSAVPAPVGIIGPGTGLGVAGLVPCGRGWTAVPGEGGHVTLAPASDEETQLLAALRRKYGHVSAERVLSGAGLVELYRWCAGEAELAIAPHEVSERALQGTDAHARAALGLFFDLLGTVAGNLALTLGARGGIYLTGGILPRMPQALAGSGFRERFLDKGRFRGYLEAIPTRLVIHPFPAFKGLAGIARRGGLTSR